MQQIYRRTLVPECGYNEVSSNFIEITLRHGRSPGEKKKDRGSDRERERDQQFFLKIKKLT